MKLIFHGGAKEVGRSCIELVTQNGRFLLDGGVKLETETKYPEGLKNLDKVDACFTTHGHLDHCGGWPYLESKGLSCPIFMTATTKDISKLLVKDFFNVESITHIPPYKKEDTFAAIDLFSQIRMNEGFEVKDAYFKFYDAGHIPGSALIFIEANGKKLVYTGDINLTETRLMKGADIAVRDVDALIIETTYGEKEHPDRKNTEKDFIEKIKETLKRGGKVFIPAFSVGRAQEIILLLNTEKWNVPVYLDGMSRDMTDIIIRDNSAKDVEKLISAKNKVIYVNGRLEREKYMKRQGIFISPAGMMTGGPIMDYMKEGHQDPKNSILLTGYVDTGTNGRLLLEEGNIFIEGRKTKVRAEYHQYDFSAHSGMNELKEIVKRINPGKVILIHGEISSLNHFSEIVRKMGKEVFIPEIGSEINI